MDGEGAQGELLWLRHIVNPRFLGWIAYTTNVIVKYDVERGSFFNIQNKCVKYMIIVMWGDMCDFCD